MQAQKNVTLLSKGGEITTKNTVTSVAGSIDATANGNVTTNAALSARQGTISVTSDAADVAVKAEATAKDDVTLKAEAGSIAVDGAVISTAGNVTGYDYY